MLPPPPPPLPTCAGASVIVEHVGHCHDFHRRMHISQSMVSAKTKVMHDTVKRSTAAGLHHVEKRCIAVRSLFMGMLTTNNTNNTDDINGGL